MRKSFVPLSISYPELAEEWDDERDISTVSAGVGYKARWKCQSGHNWKAAVYSRSKSGRGCPYCSGRLAVAGHTDLLTTNPVLASEWDDERDVRTVLSTSSYKAQWKCEKGHTWKASLNNRTRMNSGCPYCAGKKILTGYNDLLTLYPEIADEFSPENTKRAYEVSPGSHEKYEWICGNGHRWNTSVANRTRLNRGCIYCTGQKVLIGFNDLESTSPHLAEEWNDARDVKTITSGSTYQAEWKCREKGHIWNAVVALRSRPKDPTGCPQCWANSYVSQPEQELYDYVVNIFPEGVEVQQSNRSLISPYELDIYIPEKNVAVEFNGLYWHSEAQGKGRNYHYNKWKRCGNKGVQLIQVWEDDYARRPDLIQRIIQDALSSGKEKVVSPEDVIFSNVDRKTAQEFVEQHHIHGFNDSDDLDTWYYGLLKQSSQNLLSVIRVEHNEDKEQLEVISYASAVNIGNGLSILLDSVIQKVSTLTTNPVKRIRAMSSNDYSSGREYEETEFTRVSIIEPRCYYLKNGYRNLIRTDDRKNKENQEESNPIKMWDSGVSVWEKNIGTRHPL